MTAANSETVVGKEAPAEGKEALKEKLKLFFRGAQSLKDVEQKWKEDVCVTNPLRARIKLRFSRTI